jgi:7-keto-8-aminopelargonate synthetase-like enzyme
MRLLRDAMHDAHTYHYYGIRRSVDNVHVRMTLPLAKRPQKYVNFASYDYLGLSSDPEVRAAAQQTIEKFGVSATATPPNGGNSHHHEELEDTLARMVRKEAALVFTSGFAANVGCLTALLNTGDLAVADFYSHASIQDGLSAAKGETRYFRHNDMDHLDRTLTELRPKHNGVLTLTEGLFSMDGDAANLRRFIEVSRAHGAQTFIDEVHSFGIAGPGGLGFAEREGVLDDFDLYIGSLSKGIGAGGGFVAASRDVIEYLRFAARMELFSSALPPCLAAAALKALDIVRNDPSRRRRLHENTRHFREGLADLGYALDLDPDSPIIPLIIGDPQRMAAMNDVLIEHHVFANLIIYPAVALDQCRFRFMVSANHSFADIELALAALRHAGSKAGISPEDVNRGVIE